MSSIPVSLCGVSGAAGRKHLISKPVSGRSQTVAFSILQELPNDYKRLRGGNFAAGFTNVYTSTTVGVTVGELTYSHETGELQVPLTIASGSSSWTFGGTLTVTVFY